MASESIAHEASWAIDSQPIRARGIIAKWTKALDQSAREDSLSYYKLSNAVSKTIFSALWASVWSENKGGRAPWAPPLDPPPLPQAII